MIKIERREKRQTGSPDIERAIRIEKPLAALPRDDRTKAEITIFFLEKVVGGECVFERLFVHV